jgi:hypothetical protein
MYGEVGVSEYFCIFIYVDMGIFIKSLKAYCDLRALVTISNSKNLKNSRFSVWP